MERFETHISLVFLAGSGAWKIKRLVRFAYLDFSTLGADAAHVAARVTLSREVVDFLQTELPAVAATLVHFVGAVAMLCVLKPWVGALAVLALLPIGLSGSAAPACA